MAKKSSRGMSRSIIFIVVLVLAGLFFGRMSTRIITLVKVMGWILAAVIAAFALLALVAYLKRDKGILALNDCDPQTAIALNEKRIASLKGKSLSEKKRFRLNVLLNNQAVAYHAMGDIPKAVETLKEVDAAGDTGKYSIFVVTHHNLAYYYLELGRKEDYEAEWVLLRDFLAELPAETAKQYGGVFDHLEAKRLMMAGKYKKCLDYYVKSVEEEDEANTALISRVVTRFELGVVYKEVGLLEEAAEQLEFVANHGKNIAIAEEARQMLTEMSQEAE